MRHYTGMIRCMKTFHETVHRPEIVQRFQETMELFETALGIQRQNIRRRHPELPEEEVDERLQEWLLDRPGDHTSPTFRRSTRWRRLLQE